MDDNNLSSPAAPPPLHSFRPLRRRHFNRIFACLYSLAVISLLYRHLLAAIYGGSILTPLLLLAADSLFAFLWLTGQAFRMNPVTRKEFPENLRHHISRKDSPPIDIFICTADPYKEPPIVAVNTALSVMAYDYPPEKLSVYVSDDGGSELTMFAFMEAAKFAKKWLKFCRENQIMDRNPQAYFDSGNGMNLEIKNLYENMKSKVETIVDRGKIMDDYVNGEDELEILRQFAVNGFTAHDHPSVIQILLNSNKDKDEDGVPTPNLVYVTREKKTGVPHHFKAGALNVLLRVSACMTNSPIILTLDCDMYSNDPITAQRTLSYLNNLDPQAKPNIAFVQFPQLFHGINKGDIYGGELKLPFQVNPLGLDGLRGPTHVGTCCFFRRRVFFGGPSSYIEPENLMLNPYRVSDKAIDDSVGLSLAQVVARCKYEDETDWGSKIGFFYGSLVEDYYTGYRLQCRGWRSISCDPKRPAFLGDAPISLIDSLGQTKRWCIGLLEVSFCEFSPLTFGVKSIGLLMGFAYAHYSFWAIRSIPVTIYAFFLPLALLRGIPIFPEVKDPWALVYLFLFVGAYAQECFEFVSKQGTFLRWWNSQRIWLVQGLSSHLFGVIEYTAKHIGITTHGFNVTSKVSSDEQRKRYDRDVFEFGVHSSMFVPSVAAAILNLVAYIWGCVLCMNKAGSGGELFLHMAIVGFGVVNALPFYEAMFFRGDEGRIPVKTSVVALLMVVILYGVACVLL